MKIIHAADIHLDSHFTLADPEQAEKRRLSLRTAFSSLVLYAKTEGIQLFIISGDLFDSESVTKDTTIALCRDMASAKNTRFVIAPGNHDPYNSDSPYKLVSWPENVFVFKSPEISHFDFPELDAVVYGYAFSGDTMTEDPLRGFHVEDESKINILAAHCDFAKQTSYYAPVELRDLENSGLDYAALGHVHKAAPIASAGKTLYAYSGCVEGRDFGETGDKGAVVGEITRDKVDLRHVRFALKRYEVAQCDITGAKSFSDIEGVVREKCSGFGDDTMLRVVLTGITSADFYTDVNMLRSILPRPCYIELKDETLALLDSKSLEADKSLAGEFYRSLKEKLLSQDENERKTASMALKFGLRAVSGMELKL